MASAEISVRAKALHHGTHPALKPLALLLIVPARQFVALTAHLLPRLHEPVGAQFGIAADFGLQLHRADGISGATIGGLADQARFAREGRVDIPAGIPLSWSSARAAIVCAFF